MNKKISVADVIKIGTLLVLIILSYADLKTDVALNNKSIKDLERINQKYEPSVMYTKLDALIENVENLVEAINENKKDGN